MPASAAALTGLLPLAGAIAVVFKGVTRIRARRDRAPYVPPQAKEPAPAGPPARRSRKTPKPDASCEACGTSIPHGDNLCAPCDRKRAGSESKDGSTALHWLAFIAMMLVIFGAGALLAP